MMRKVPFRLPLPRWMRQVGWRTAAAGVLLGGIVHISSTFGAPMLASGNAYQQLSAMLPPNRVVVLPAPAPGRQILPYLQPDALYAMCRYDLVGGPVSVTAAVAGPGWVLSLHTPAGDNFYVLPGRQLRRGEVSFLLVPSGTVEAAQMRRHASPTDTQVASPTHEGLIVMRAPIIGLAWRAKTEAILRRSSCTQVKR